MDSESLDGLELPEDCTHGARRLFALAYRLVPASERAEWAAEWSGELAALARRSRSASAEVLDAGIARIALRDAWWLRTHPRRSRDKRRFRPEGLALHPPIDASEGGRGRWLLDLRFSARRLWRSKGFSFVVLALLAGSIAATTVSYTLVRSVLERPLPYRESERLVRIVAHEPRTDAIDWVSRRQLEALLSASSFDGVAYVSVFPAIWRGEAQSERAMRAVASVDYFSVLGIEPLLGSVSSSGGEAVLLSEPFWRRVFQGDADVIGRTLTVDDRAHTVAGVLPETAYGHELSGTVPELWVMRPLEQVPFGLDGRFFTAVARLGDGVSLDRAREEAALVQARVLETEPEAYRGWALEVTPLLDTVVAGSRGGLRMLLVATLLLSFAVAINLAALTLTRFLSRRPELALHVALGARRGAVARQAATESLLLACAGTLLGVACAGALASMVARWLPLELPRLGEIALDPRVVLGSALVGFSSLLLFGWLPARLSLRGDLEGEIRSHGRGPDRRSRRWQRALVAGQVALALPLLVATGLLVRSLWWLEAAPTGVTEPSELWSARLSLPIADYREASDRVSFFERLLDQVEALPQVESGGAALKLPFLSSEVDRVRLEIEGQAAEEGNRPHALFNTVSRDYFETLGTNLLEGRRLEARDTQGAPAVVLVDQEFVDRYLDGRSPLGLEVTLDWVLTPGEPAVREIVGVVENLVDTSAAVPPEPHLYAAHDQSSWPSMAVVLRSRGESGPALRRLEEIARTLEPGVIVDEIEWLGRASELSLGNPRAVAWLAAALALVVTLLSGLGLYGSLSRQVLEGRSEIAVRLALGATRGGVLRHVVAQGLAVATLGSVLGLFLSLLMGRMLQSSLHGVEAIDPWVLVGAPLVLLAVTLIAAWLPGRRAAGLAPAQTLREG